MPTYEYECRRCSTRFEVRRRFSENSSVPCPKCQSEARLVFSPVPVIFKGSGFYITDNRSGGGDNFISKPDESKSSDEGESKVEEKGEE